jgi:hypothetical protein
MQWWARQWQRAVAEMRSTALLMMVVTWTSEARVMAAAAVLAMTAVRAMAAVTEEARATVTKIAVVWATTLTTMAVAVTTMTW